MRVGHQLVHLGEYYRMRYYAISELRNLIDVCCCAQFEDSVGHRLRDREIAVVRRWLTIEPVQRHVRASVRCSAGLTTEN